MELDDGLTVTEAQWMEHSDAWRLAHLHRAPSAYLRQQAISGQDPTSEAAGLRQTSTWRSHLALEMMMVLAVVAVVVIAAALR